MKSIVRSYIVVTLSFLFPVAGLAQMQQKKAASDTHEVVLASAVAFQPLEVPGFASGLKLAVIHGDPNAASGGYTVRLSLPDGYKFPAHWHPMGEHVTVLEGEFLLGMGDKTDEAKQQTYTVGTFIYIPAKMSHFGGAKGATVIQLHGEAPFKIELTNPAAK